MKRLITLSLLLVSAAANAVTYNITQLSALSSGEDASAYGMNDNGQVVGNAYNTTSGVMEAVIWNNGVVQSLGVQGIARAVNNSGVVVGENGRQATNNKTGDGYAYMWDTNNGYQELGTLMGASCVTDCYSGAYDINDSGVITGNSFTIDSPFGLLQMHAYTYQNGAFTDLPPPNATSGYSRGIGINNNGTVIGRASVNTFTNSDKYMGQWDSSGAFTHDNPPGDYSSGRDVNNNNIAVGIARATDGGPNQAAIWDSAGNVSIFAGSGGNLRGRFNAVNDAGIIVGALEESLGEYKAVISLDGSTVVDLESIVDITGTGFMSLDEAFDINENGDIIGFGTMTNGEQGAFYITAVPVPAAVWLFGSALGALGWIRRRKA